MIRFAMLFLVLATAAPGADFLNTITGRVYRIPAEDAGSLADFRAPASVAAGNVEIDADLIPIEALTGGSLAAPGGDIRLDLRADRGDDGRPAFRYDSITKRVIPRRLADLTTYRTTRELQVRAGKLAAVVEADAKLAALTELEKAPPAGATPEALALVRQQMEADRASMAADLAR